MATNTLAYGFQTLTSVMRENVTQVGVDVVQTAIAESAALYTQKKQDILSSMVRLDTIFKTRFKLPGNGELQPLDVGGNATPRPVIFEGFFDVAFPLIGGGTATGTNRVARAKMTVDMANRWVLEAQRMDSKWVTRMILSAILDNTSYVHVDIEHGSLTIEPLANGDITFDIVGATTEASDHYQAQAAAIDDSNSPYQTIFDQLKQHPSNGNADVVCFIATSLKAATEALIDFVPVQPSAVVAGVSSDQLVGLSDSEVTRIRGMGDKILGFVEDCWIVEFKSLPAGYIIGQAIGITPLVMRQHPETELQGLFTESDNGDGNIWETRLIRYAGFGAENRIAAMAYEVGNASYTIPTDFSTPRFK